MSTPVEEHTQVMPDLGEPTHIVCCEDITKTFCEETIPAEEVESMDDVAITCPECIEVEQNYGLGACPCFPICAHAHCGPHDCKVRP